MKKYSVDDFTLVLKSPMDAVLKEELVGKKKILIRNSSQATPSFFLAKLDRKKDFCDVEEVHIIGNGRFFSSDDGQMVFYRSKRGIVTLVLAVCNKDEIVVPDGVHRIGTEAFMDSDIRSVKLPETLMTIGNSAFFGCEKLESIEIHSVKIIEKYAFGMCNSLADIILPEGLIKIEDFAFFYCEKLEEITIPSSVKNMGNSSLGFVDMIHLEGNEFPYGIFSAADNKDRSVSMKIQRRKNILILPRCIKPSLYKKVNAIIKDVNPEKEEVINLYNMADSPRDKYKIALEGYSLKQDLKIKAFLRKSFFGILYGCENEEEFLSVFDRFKNFELLTERMTSKALVIAQEKNWVQAAVHVLEETQKYTKEKIGTSEDSTFRL